MKPADLGMRPGVEHPRDLATGVRIRAVGLARARVADVGAGSVADQPQLRIGLDPLKPLTLRALPGVELLVVGEAGGAVELGAAMRMPRKQIESEGHQDKEEGVSRSQQAVGRDAAHPVPAGCFGSVTSVNRISSGSSMTTRFTVCRTPM